MMNREHLQTEIATHEDAIASAKAADVREVLESQKG